MGIWHMTRLCCSAQYVAARVGFKIAVLLVVASCGTVELFGQYDLPEGAEVADAPYPRLIDVPQAPEQGSYTASVPDPVQGARTQADLSAEAVVAERAAEELSGPVISEAEKARLLARAKRKR